MRIEGRSEPEILTSLTTFAVAAHHENKAFHKEMLAMQITEPEVAAWDEKPGEKDTRRAFSISLTP